MRILLKSNHRYPADSGRGVGVRVRSNPSGAPQMVHDLIARGLAELGHRVFYLVEGVDAPLPDGVEAVTEPVWDVDVCHNVESPDRPWLLTQHGFWGLEGGAPANFVFVSRSLAAAEGSGRYVLNGLDPADYLYSEAKENYFLFMAAMQGPFHRAIASRQALGREKYKFKGLDVALGLARRLGMELIVAGTAREEETLALIGRMCAESGARFVGDVRGAEKATLLARARALLFPTQVREGCPLAVIESLLSGTPVIASDIGVCREMVGPEVGFVCGGAAEYEQAIESVDRISPRICREEAVRRYHYLRMARDYVEQYERQIDDHRGRRRVRRK